MSQLEIWIKTKQKYLTLRQQNKQTNPVDIFYDTRYLIFPRSQCQETRNKADCKSPCTKQDTLTLDMFIKSSRKTSFRLLQVPDSRTIFKLLYLKCDPDHWRGFTSIFTFILHVKDCFNYCFYLGECIVWGYVSCEYMCPQRLEEGVRYPEPGLRGSCEPSDVDAENQTWVFWKNRQCSYCWSISPAPRLLVFKLRCLCNLFSYQCFLCVVNKNKNEFLVLI